MTDPDPSPALPPRPAPPAVERSKASTASLVVLAIVAAAAGLHLGRGLLAPVAFAAVLAVVFRPIVRRAERLRVPPTLTSGLIVLALLGALIGLTFILAGRITQWMPDIPNLLAQAEKKLEKFRAPVQKVTDAVEKFQHPAPASKPAAPATAATPHPSSAPAPAPAATNPPPPSPASTPTPPAGSEPAPASATPDANGPDTGQPSTATPAATSTATPATSTTTTPVPAGPSVLATLFGTTESVITGLIEVLLLLFLILAGGEPFVQKVIGLLPLPDNDGDARAVAHQVERTVLRYLLTLAAMNTLLATVIGLLMWWLGMPGPVLWAAATFVLEFIPYLGAAVMVTLLALVAFTTFNGLGHALLIPGCYLVVSTLQNSVVGPMVYGRGLKLNPVTVLLAVLVWGALWGVPGAFLAVPIVAITKIMADQIPMLRPVGRFLGE